MRCRAGVVVAICIMAAWMVAACASALDVRSQSRRAAPRIESQTAHVTDVVSIVISKDHRYAVSVALDGDAVLWDMATARVIRHFTTLAPANAVSLSPNGPTVAVCNEAIIGLWNLRTARQIWRVPARRNPDDNQESFGCQDLAFTPDGRSIVMAGSWSGRLLDASDGRELRFFETPPSLAGRQRVFNAVAVSSDGRVAFTAGADGAAIWSIADARILRPLEESYLSAESAAISPDGRLVAAGSIGNARIWDVATGKRVKDLEKNIGWISQLRFSDGGKTLLAACAVEGLAWSWDIATEAEMQHFEGHGVPVIGRTPTFSDDGRLVIAQPATADDESPFRLLQPRTATPEWFRIWDASTGRQSNLLRSTRAPLTALALDLSGRFAALATGQAVTVFDLEAGGQLPDVLRHEQSVDFMRFDRQGRRLLTNSGDDTLTIWDLRSGTGTRLIRPVLPRTGSGIQDVPKVESLGVNGAVFSRRTIDAVFSEDGRWLVTREEYFLRRWDLRDGTQQLRLPALGESSALEMLSDGTVLQDNGNALKALRPDASTMERVREFEKDARVVALSSDGRHAVLTSPAHPRSRLVDVSTGRTIWEIDARGPAVLGRFSPDNRRLLLGTADQRVTLWNVSQKRLVKEFPTWQYDDMDLAASRPLLLAGRADAGMADLFDGTTGRALVSLGITGEHSWLITTPQGHFDATDLEELSGMSWIFDDDPLTPLGPEMFIRDYFEPRLLPRVLAGETMPPVRDLTRLNRAQPCVLLEASWEDEVAGRARVIVHLDRARRQWGVDCQASDQPTNIYALRLLRSGQLVGAEPKLGIDRGREASFSGRDDLPAWRAANRIRLDAAGKRAIEFHVQVPMTDDVRTVTFSAYAFNNQRVKTATVSATLDRTLHIASRPGTAYVIAVGVNRTQSSPRWDLRFAAADARLMCAVLPAALKSTEQFGRVVAVSLVSDSSSLPGEAPATRENLRTVLDLLSGRPVDDRRRGAIPMAAELQKARPEDFVLLSFSSHGFTDERGSFHLVLEDIGENRPETTSDRQVIDNSLSSEQLAVWLSDVDAGEIVMVIDACHSEASVNERGFKPAPIGSRGLGQLAYEKGMRILAASQTAQTAAERDGLGVLTRALLRDGLQEGHADFQKKDGRITLREWLEYGARRVSELRDDQVARPDSPDPPAYRAFYVGGKKVLVRHQRPVYFDFSRHRSDPTVKVTR
jgi:WD40 repeat protein